MNNDTQFVDTLRVVAEGRIMLRVSNGVTVSRSMLVKAADEITRLRAEHAAKDARIAELEAALLALDDATVNSIRILRDGFVIEGRAADEWLKFMRLIQKVACATLTSTQPAFDSGETIGKEPSE